MLEIALGHARTLALIVVVWAVPALGVAQTQPTAPATGRVVVSFDQRDLRLPGRATAETLVSPRPATQHSVAAAEVSPWGRALALGVGLLVGAQAARMIAAGPIPLGIGVFLGGLASQLVYLWIAL